VQSLLKRHFYIINLVFIAAAAYLTARAANKFVGYLLTPPLSNGAAASAQTAGTGGPAVATRDYARATERNIFGARREIVEANAVEEDDSVEVDLSSDPVPTTLAIKLIGTMVFTVPEWSDATIQDLGSKSTDLYSINACRGDEGAFAKAMAGSGGDDAEEEDVAEVVVRSIARPAPCNRLLDSGTILVIARTRVTFINDSSGRKEYIELGMEVTGGATPIAARSTSKKRNKGPSGEGIKKVGANSYEVAQSEIDATLANLNTIATQARIVPSFKDGKANGFKLFSIRPNSLYAKIGIQNGDVIQRINGYELSSPDKTLEIYTKLKDSKQVTVDLQRRGKPNTIDYSIVP